MKKALLLCLLTSLLGIQQIAASTLYNDLYAFADCVEDEALATKLLESCTVYVNGQKLIAACQQEVGEVAQISIDFPATALSLLYETSLNRLLSFIRDQTTIRVVFYVAITAPTTLTDVCASQIDRWNAGQTRVSSVSWKMPLTLELRLDSKK